MHNPDPVDPTTVALDLVPLASRKQDDYEHLSVQFQPVERDRETGPSSTGPSSAVPRSIPNSVLLEQVATSRFFHHYVSSTRTFFRLDLDFTHSVIEGASRRGILAEAIIAMGILTLPNKSRSACVAARIRHNRALRLTSKALRSPKYVMSDELLMAVILLGLYEVGKRRHFFRLFDADGGLEDHPRCHSLHHKLAVPPQRSSGLATNAWT